MYITDIKVNDDHKSAILELDQFRNSLGNIPPWNHTFCFIVMV